MKMTPNVLLLLTDADTIIDTCGDTTVQSPDELCDVNSIACSAIFVIRRQHAVQIVMNVQETLFFAKIMVMAQQNVLNVLQPR
jgi:hypothetical protein